MDWSAVPAWTNTNFYYTPNIRTVIQEIVSGGGWSDSNEDLGIFIQNNSSSASAYRQAGSLEDGGPVPYLLVIYKSGTLVQGIIAADATCSDYNYITNYHAGLYNTLAEGITHAYAYDASLGTFSANIMTAALPVALYPAVPANNDCLYIGAVDTAIGALEDKNVFTNVVFDVGTAATYAAGTSSTWQYWNGAAWAGLHSTMRLLLARRTPARSASQACTRCTLTCRATGRLRSSMAFQPTGYVASDQRRWGHRRSHAGQP